MCEGGSCRSCVVGSDENIGEPWKVTIRIQMQVQSGKLGKSVTERERKRERDTLNTM